VAERPENRVFGKRAQQHVVILASGDKIRHMTIRPWMAAVTFCFAGMFTVGYLAATSYLVLRDDLIGATMARQARMQHDYEDRISALRAQVDRVTSRQLLDQQVVEEKVEKLMQQQLALSQRHGKLDALLNRAETVPLPDEKPVTDGRRADAVGAINAIMGGVTPQKTTQLAYASTGESVADRADRLFSRVTLSLKDLEHDQLNRIQSLTAGASETADAIQTILRRTGFDVTKTAAADGQGATTQDDAETAIGGPFVEPETFSNPFEESINDLDDALDRLDAARRTARKPLRQPYRSVPRKAGAACRHRLPREHRHANPLQRRWHRYRRRPQRRLRQHGGNRPWWRPDHALRSSFPRPGQGRRPCRGIRSGRPFRHDRALHRPAPAL
jgi:hypothetical protein